MLEVSVLGVGTAVLRLEREAWSMVNGLRQATNEYAPPAPAPHCFVISSVRALFCLPHETAVGRLPTLLQKNGLERFFHLGTKSLG